MGYALNNTLGVLDVEIASNTNRYAPGIGAGFFALDNVRFNQVAGLESLNPLLPGQVATRESILVQAGALVAAAPCGFDRQGEHIRLDARIR